MQWGSRARRSDAEGTPDEAATMFARHDLTGPIWELPAGGERF
jgi:hypothetical protein